MKNKHREFMDLQQGNQSVYIYSKLFNHLTQYTPEQVDTDEKKYHFMNGLSTKLQECLALNVDWTFLELVSNAIVADDAIRAHQESKKKNALAAPLRSAPHKYRWCVLHIATHHSSIIISWLSVHRRIRISCLELWHPHRPCCTHHHRRWAWSHADATIVVMLAISPRSVRHRGRVTRLDFRVTPTIH
jgi:hypothetical protein